MKLLIFIVTINLCNVNCGLLKELLTPVTEKVQNNELLNEHERKNEEPAKKGVLTNVVDSLDTGADKLVNLLTKDNKKDKDVKATTKPANGNPESTSTTQKPTPKPGVETEKDLKTNDTVTTTPDTNATKSEDDNKVKNVTIAEDAKEDTKSVTPVSSSTEAKNPTVEAQTSVPEGNSTDTIAAEKAEGVNN